MGERAHCPLPGVHSLTALERNTCGQGKPPQPCLQGLCTYSPALSFSPIVSEAL